VDGRSHHHQLFLDGVSSPYLHGRESHDRRRSRITPTTRRRPPPGIPVAHDTHCSPPLSRPPRSPPHGLPADRDEARHCEDPTVAWTGRIDDRRQQRRRRTVYPWAVAVHGGEVQERDSSLLSNRISQERNRSGGMGGGRREVGEEDNRQQKKRFALTPYVAVSSESGMAESQRQSNDG
jgi:hypothetical protein